MYVCMYLFMYVFMDVCMYVCMDGWMDGWMDGCAWFNMMVQVDISFITDNAWPANYLQISYPLT
jgi:hypothetical protein